MISVNANLLAASEKGTGIPIFTIELFHYLPGGWISSGSFDVIQAKLTRLKYTIRVHENLVGDPYILTTAGAPYAITVRRGLNVAGTDYTYTSRKYFVSVASYLANEGYTELIADLLPAIAIRGIAADVAAATVIDNALTSVLVTDYAQDNTRDCWYTWQFYPTTKTLDLFDARSLSPLLATKYFAYLFPRSTGLYVYNVPSNFENGEDGAYIPFSHARVKSVVASDKYLNLSWVSETGKNYMTRAAEYAYHYLGFIADAVNPITVGNFTEWGQVSPRHTYEIHQRPDFRLEQGDLLTLSLDDYGHVRCIELTEIYKTGKNPEWTQIITQLPHHPQAGSARIGDFPDNPEPKPTASNVLLATGNFTQLLSPADSDVQAAMDTIDNLAYFLKMANGGIIGQTAGPQIKFDDTQNELEISNANVGIGTPSPDTLLHLLSAVSAEPTIKLENTNADNNAPSLYFYKNSASPLNADYIGFLSFYGKDDAGTILRHALISVQMADASAGATVTRLTIKGMVSGVDTAAFTIVNGKVGINTTAPAAQLAINGGLHVGGDSDPGDNNLLVDGTLQTTGDILIDVTANAVFRFLISSVEQGAFYCLTTDDNFNIRATKATGKLTFRTGGSTVRMTIDAAGKVGIADAAPAEMLDVTGNANVTGVYKVDDVQVVGNQGAAVANATDAASVIARLNDLLARLRTHGLIAT